MSDYDILQRWHNTKFRKCDTRQRIKWLEWGLQHYWIYHPCAKKCRLHERDFYLAELDRLKNVAHQ